MRQISFWQIWIMLGLMLLKTAPVSAQEAELTLNDLFAQPKLTGITPSQPVWAPNSEHFAFTWSEPGTTGRGLWISTNDGKEPLQSPFSAIISGDMVKLQPAKSECW